jgi:hypothetical protein
MALSKKDVESIKNSIVHGGEFRAHLIYSRSGMGVKCRMWHPDGHVAGSAGGCGYDKGGAALGQAIELFFQKELDELPLETRDTSYSGKQLFHETLGDMYGLFEGYGGPGTEGKRRRYLDGACGMSCMEKVLRALGFQDVRVLATGKLSEMVLATGRPKPGQDQG